MGRGAGTDDRVGLALPFGELDGPGLPDGRGLCDAIGAIVGSGEGVGGGVGLGGGSGVAWAATSNGIPPRAASEAPKPPKLRARDRAAAARTAPLIRKVPFTPHATTSLPRNPGPAGDPNADAVAASSGGLVGGRAVVVGKGSAAAAREVFRFGLEAGASGAAVIAVATPGVALAAASGVVVGRAGDQRGRSPLAAATTSVGLSRPTSSRRP
jgi:hypothetical protein